MVVSHYVVSWIQVIGVAVGLLGFFYVSIGLFGKAAPSLLRPLLPALALAIVGTVGPLVVQVPGQGRDPVTTIVTAIVCFGAGYFMGYYSQSPQPANKNKAKSVGRFIIPVLLGIQVVTFLLPGTAVSLTIFSIVLSAAVLAALYLPALLTERTMITIGSVATVLAFLTQFIPPMLDLLNIPIR